MKKPIFLAISSVVAALLLLAFPAFTNAGFFSVIAGLLGDSTSEAPKETSVNSQNMLLLQAAVHLDPNPAKGGGDIAIVDGSALLAEDGPSGTIADVGSGTENDHISLYVVRKGDTLSGIAKLFSVSVNTIAWANDIKNGVIQPGQQLVILPISGVQHTVVKGDTIASLAKKYKGDAEEITQFNGLREGEALAVGMQIIIPDGTVAGSPSLGTSISAKVRGAGGPSYEGYYLRPILGGRKTQGLHGYNGVDFGAGPGTPVLAAAEGTVIISRNYGWNGGYGTYIVISHPNGTQTLYAHLNRTDVFQGQYVVRGQVIGASGNTGRSTGPHLHFEVRGAKNPF